jgi:hypothetical protein
MDALLTLLSQLQYWHWFALAIVLLGLELATGTTYLLWPAAAAFVTGVLMLLIPMAWPAQFVAFSVATLAGAYLGRRYIKGKWLGRSDAPHLNEPHRELAGQRGVAAIAFENGIGRVRHGDTEWRAESKDVISAGDTVEIVTVEGASLIVKKVKTLPKA